MLPRLVLTTASRDGLFHGLILQRRKLKHREVVCLTQGHTASIQMGRSPFYPGYQAQLGPFILRIVKKQASSPFTNEKTKAQTAKELTQPGHGSSGLWLPI